MAARALPESKNTQQNVNRREATRDRAPAQAGALLFVYLFFFCAARLREQAERRAKAAMSGPKIFFMGFLGRKTFRTSGGDYGPYCGRLSFWLAFFGGSRCCRPPLDTGKPCGHTCRPWGFRVFSFMAGPRSGPCLLSFCLWKSGRFGGIRQESFRPSKIILK